MLKQFVVATAFVLSIGAAPTPNLYDLQLRVSRPGTTLATPRLLVRATEQARFATQDVSGAGWTVSMTPTPGKIGGTASVAVAIDVEGRHVTVAGRPNTTEQFHQRVTVTVEVKDPGTARFDVPARGGAPGLRVDLTLASKTALSGRGAAYRPG